MQLGHEYKELRLRARIPRDDLVHSLQGWHRWFVLGNVWQNRLCSTVLSRKLRSITAFVDGEMAVIRWSMVQLHNQWV